MEKVVVETEEVLEEEIDPEVEVQPHTANKRLTEKNADMEVNSRW